MSRWLLLKDILLTTTAMALVLSQIFSAAPSDILLATGLALTAQPVAWHARSLLAARTGTPSSPPASLSGGQHSGSTSPEAAGERGTQ